MPYVLHMWTLDFNFYVLVCVNAIEGTKKTKFMRGKEIRDLKCVYVFVCMSVHMCMYVK